MMKKITVAFVTVVIICASCMGVFAAGLNASEQSVLDNMSAPANMNGNTVYVPASYQNQAEAYFNTIDMTSEQADEINGYISAGRSFLEGTGKSSMGELSEAQTKKFMEYANAAAGVLQLSAAGDENSVKIINDDGEVIIDDSGDVIKPTGGEESADYTVTYAVIAVLGALFVLSAAYAVIRRKVLKYEEVKQ